MEAAVANSRKIRFVFNERKAAQAAAYILRLHGAPSRQLFILKLLYLADRKSLLEAGKPITGDHPYSMEHGVVLTSTYNLLKRGQQGRRTEWSRHVWDLGGTEGYEPVSDAVDELSEYERSVLDAVYGEYGHFTPWQLRELTHELPEWEDPGDRSIPIDIEQILRAGGVSAERIQQIAREAEEDEFIDTLSE